MRKLSGIIVVIIMLLFTLGILCACTDRDGGTEESFESGDGSEANPYIIANSAQLALLAKYCNENNSKFNAAHYALSANIDLGDKPWTPIGTYLQTDTERVQAYFAGNFDGRGFTISNYLLTTRGSAYYCYGLFGYVTNGEIKNLSVKCSASIEIANGNVACFIGGLCGMSGAKISNCNSEVDFSVTFSDKENTSTYTVGALCGSLSGAIMQSCFSFGKINVDTKNTYEVAATLMQGGAVGYALSSTLSECASFVEIASANVAQAYAGGLVGTLILTSAINNCYATGNVLAATTGEVAAAGLCGQMMGNSVVSACFATGDVSAQSKRGGAIAAGLCAQLQSEQCTVEKSFATGDVSAVCGGENFAVAGGALGRTWGVVMDKTFRFEGQTVESQNRDNKMASINESGTPCTLEQLNSANFYAESLCWEIGVQWDTSTLDFEQGVYPCLTVE